MFYTYAHYRADDKRIFYIGKGKAKRHTSHKNRNPYWHNIVNKHGFTSEILARWDTDLEALQHEESLIRVFRSMGQPLANISDGGKGPKGRILTDADKENLRNKNLGKKQSRESIEKTRLSNIGRKHSPEWVEKVRLSNIGRKHTDESRLNMSLAHRGERRDYQDVAVKCLTLGVVFPSITVAHCLTGAQKGNIVKVCRGQRTSTLGLKFEYVK